MNNNTAPPPFTDLMHEWRRQIGYRYTLAGERGPRPFAVLGYLVRGPLVEGRYVSLRHLTLVALFDHQLEDGRLATRLVGVAGVAKVDGLSFGGREHARFDKNLRLAPVRGSSGARLSTTNGSFFEFALALERYLERCSRHPYMPRRSIPQLPVLAESGPMCPSPLVDLKCIPKRQVISLASPTHDLVGRAGATEYDLVNTRFRLAAL